MTEDFVAWQYTKSYSFSVRSAYYVEWEHQFGAQTRRGDGQGTMNTNPVWDILWKLQIPSKVIFFAWRALHGIVPGMSVLANRHIKVHPQCPVCKQGAEDLRHLMFTCERAKQIWKKLGLHEIITEVLPIDRSGSVILEELLTQPARQSPILGRLGLRESLLVGAWYIWWQRREFVKGKSIQNPSSTAFAIQAITSNSSSATDQKKVEKIGWVKPPSNHYKLNVDAAFFYGRTGAAAVVLRNSKGEALAGASWIPHHVLDATTAEAVAIQRGLEMVEDLGCQQIIVESDSLEVIQACNGVIEIWSPYTAILAECFQIAYQIGTVSFVHCFREANRLAHNLARYSFSLNSSFVWDGDPPRFLIPDIVEDVTVI